LGLTSNQRQLDYDLLVGPGIDPEVIRLAFDANNQYPLLIFYAFKQAETKKDQRSSTG